ncbi:MAG TPA: type IV secretion system protein [Rhodospirillaceae bacterium]|nr:type IV secretion system protein [Rhodospirillaceae bacterium]
MTWLATIFSRSAPAMAGGDRLGLYPAERDVPALEGRRYLWTARAFAIGMFLSLCLNAVLAFAIASLSPLVRVEPMLLSFKDRGEQLVQVEPFSKGTRGFELMSEMLVRDYVLWREEVVLDEGEMRRRWGGGGVIAHRSDPEEYRRFVTAMAPKYEELRQKRLIRKVAVHRVSKISDGYWQVEFTTADVDPLRDQGGERTWLASLSAAYLPTAVRWEDRYMNPLGFVVLSYSVAQSK